MTADSKNTPRQRRYVNKKRREGYFMLQMWVKRENREKAKELLRQLNLTPISDRDFSQSGQ
jgi:hypothetical protein